MKKPSALDEFGESIKTTTSLSEVIKESEVKPKNGRRSRKKSAKSVKNRRVTGLRKEVRPGNG